MNLYERIALGEKGEKLFLLGNEAIARGIIEADAQIVTTYPGTPSSEIGNTLAVTSRLYDKPYYFEFSVNEKVAFEVAASAAAAGYRSATFMKHVGLNVASDALMTSAYIGVTSGFVVITCDDPNCWSSQNEQDNRFYAYLANLPLLEPSNPQEAKDMTKEAFSISEKLEVPVLVRSTTRVSHTRGVVFLGGIENIPTKKFVKNPTRFVPVPAVARGRHKILLKKMSEAKELSEKSIFNFVESNKENIYGVVACGAAYSYTLEALKNLDVEIPVLKLGMTHPLPERKIVDFLKNKDKVVIVEELEPILETQIRAIAQRNKLGTEIVGKNEGFFPRVSELNVVYVLNGLSAALNLGKEIDLAKMRESMEEVRSIVPNRPPVLCPGCPHMGSYHIIKRLLPPKTIWSSDIGCYSLGMNEPFKMADILYCMGSSIGAASGIAKTGSKAVAFIGDSTFWHAGLPELVNAVYNKHDVLVVVLDNLTTAMTGHQVNPGTGKTARGETTKVLTPEFIAEALGIPFVTVDPYEINRSIKLVNELLKRKGEGPALIVFRQKCALIRPVSKIFEVTDKCTGCQICINSLGCPALTLKNGRVFILGNLCRGCSLCAQVCPFDAIKEVRKRVKG